MHGSSSLQVADLLDRVYDTLTQGAAVVGTALGVDMSDVMPPASSNRASAASGAPFRIEEVIDGDSGRVVFTVTDGRGASCDAPTRALAEATLDTLEARGCVVDRTSAPPFGGAARSGKPDLARTSSRQIGSSK
jgi:hypothetical protein